MTHGAQVVQVKLPVGPWGSNPQPTETLSALLALANAAISR